MNTNKEQEMSKEDLIAMVRSGMDTSVQSDIERLDSMIKELNEKYNKILNMLEQIMGNKGDSDGYMEQEEELGSFTPMSHESSRQGMESETMQKVNDLLGFGKGMGQ